MSSPDADRVLGGRYRLIREIARGGMAAVWEAHDSLLDRRVAIKLLHHQYADEPEFLERFRREARAAAGLTHPNIVSIYDVGEDAETRTPFIVMELVQGNNLKDHIRRAAPLADDKIRALGAILASTLEYAHRRGVIHRDVKPQNILLDEDGRPQLTDFGIAQAAAAASGLTRTGAVMGSVHYLAPELVRGRPATPASDVYGLGAVLYEMATGRVPFEGETDMAVALAHVEETPAAPRALNAHLALGLERIIMRSLAKSPEQRFLSAGDLATVLRNGSGASVGASPSRAEATTQRIPIAAAAAMVAKPSSRQAVASPSPGAFARRTARPQKGHGASGGLLGLLLAMAAVLVALGAGFFGLATLSREGLVPAERTPAPPTARPTAAPKPAALPTSTAEPSPTPEAAPTSSPMPTPLPPSPTPPPAPPKPRSVSVPQLRGKTLDDARAALQADGLTATVRGVNVNADKNLVADQSPEAGTAQPAGATVTIMVGTGFTAIPDVANKPRDQAVKALEDDSFRAILRERRDPRVPRGMTIETRPQAGTVAPRKSDVELFISAGRPD